VFRFDAACRAIDAQDPTGVRYSILRMTIFVRLLILAALAATAFAQTPISYTVRISDPDTHYAYVEMRVPTAGRPAIELKMAVWTAYVIREFAKNLEGVEARSTSGEQLVIEKTAKNRWRAPSRSTSCAARNRTRA